MTTVDRGNQSPARLILESRAIRARAMDKADKFLAGPRLFDIVRERMLCGIRDRHPQWGEAEVEAEFGWQMVAIRAREERGVYTPVPQDAIDGAPTGAP